MPDQPLTDDAGNTMIDVTGDNIRHPLIDQIKTQASAGSVAGSVVRLVPSEEPEYVVEDDARNILLRVTGDDIEHPVIDQVKAVAARIKSLPSSAPQVVFEDDIGNILGSLSENDFVHPYAARTTRAALAGVRAMSGGVRDPKWDPIQALSEIFHIVLYGQSNSVGWGAAQVIRTLPLAYGLRFSTGVRAQDGAGTAAVNHPALTPLLETQFGGIYGYGETQATALVMMIAQLLWEEDGIDITGGALGKILVSAPGEQGVSLINRSSGTKYFQQLEDDITYGRSLSDAAALSYSAGALIEIGGESEYDANTSRATYAGQLRQLRSDVQSWGQGVAGTASPLPLFLAQVSTHLTYNRATPTSALAQIDVAADDNICLACPTYFLPFWPDNLHYPPAGRDWMGAYLGLAIKRWLWDGVKPLPLLPQHISVIGKTIILKFNLAKQRKLVFDTTTLAAQTNMGFQVVDSAGNALTIAAAPRIVGADRIAIQMSAVPAAGFQVRYAWVGVGSVAGGNLRDNRGDDIVFDRNGSANRMDNWVPIFQQGAS
ncbi:hypothetical protein [Sphingomonas abietis]|uniref:Sialate O-acetylesterase domain-containing protein n=1 Tax=Sphingomonas abietis TaxID=3012344 RepID=A0ABY7NLD4_9SPHN|nr:hypothetical protein [Sphingomonas abietis]WBO22309.1 hypothetical protein PBT88_19540 [Sphingomonas abietis]